MVLTFSGKIWYWRGPAPFYYVTIPLDQSQQIKAVSGIASYGWGVIPVHVLIGDTEFTTSLFPKDGLYLVPIKKNVRDAENLDLDDEVSIQIQIHL